MDPYKLVAISGKKRHGKDTIADHLVAKHGFTKVRFADALREVLLAQNPIVEASENHRYRVSYFVNQLGWDEAKNHPEIRTLLQRLATEGIRKQMPEFWTLIALQKADKVKGPVVISDLRFLNEIEHVRAWDPMAGLIRVVRPGFTTDGFGDTHVSETELDDYPFEHTFYNDGSVEDLHKAVDAWIR
jgi:hypothetical protein